jgi:hypothetical protein
MTFAEYYDMYSHRNEETRRRYRGYRREQLQMQLQAEAGVGYNGGLVVGRERGVWGRVGGSGERVERKREGGRKLRRVKSFFWG